MDRIARFLPSKDRIFRLGNMDCRCRNFIRTSGGASILGQISAHVQASDPKEWIFGKDMASVEFGMFKSVEVMQGPIARILGIGTLVVHCADSDRSVRFRGIKDPEVIETKLRALLPPSSPALAHEHS